MGLVRSCGPAALFQLLSMGRTLPAGVDLDEVDAPPFDLTIGDDRLTATIDWSPTGAPATFLAIDAVTSGEATVDVGPAIVANVARLTDPDEDVTIVIPPGAPWIVVVAAAWSARIRCVPFAHDGAGEQLELPFWDTISCHGGLRPDPLPDASLTDVRAFAIDPHVEVRMRAAASRWNVDVRVQRVLASDDDEQVVLALLDHVDPYRDVVEVIIDGPHVAARRELAGRNLPTELLVRARRGRRHRDGATGPAHARCAGRAHHVGDGGGVAVTGISGVDGHQLGGGIDPLDRETHYVMPATSATLCGEPIADSWTAVEPDSILIVSCRQCHTQRYWLPAAGKLDRDAELAKVIEPWPAGARKHVTGDDDPGRGRLHRPEHLQLCLTCGRAARTVRRVRQPLPLRSRGVATGSLRPAPVTSTTTCGCAGRASRRWCPGSSRWSPYHCDQCMPAVQLWRSMAGRSIVPIGPHSLMNGVGWRPTQGRGMTTAQATAFADQLNALFATQTSLHELAARRALDAARDLGFDGHAVVASDFIGARRLAGGTAETGFAELVAAYSDVDSTRARRAHLAADRRQAPLRPAIDRRQEGPMTITYTIDTWMSIDARDAAVRQAQAQGYRNITRDAGAPGRPAAATRSTCW